jgi:putative ABC transport system permease protein
MRPLAVLFEALVRFLAARNLRSDRFGTFAAVLGVALGTATVNVVLVLDTSTSVEESALWSTNPNLPVQADTVALRAMRADGSPIQAADAKVETHEDYEVMRSAVRLGSLSAFLVGALIVFFTFAVVVDRRRREVALLRSLGATPRQVAAIFAREALLIGLLGASLGFVAAIPLAKVAALAGITTTGRSTIDAVTYPFGKMALVSLVGAATALLGVAHPARDAYRLRVAETLAPRFLERDAARAAARRTRGTTLVALPFTLLVYVLMRPFFKNAVPSLAFFAVEAGLVCVAFLLTILLVPELVRRLGALVVRFLPGGPRAERLLTRRRVEHVGHELAWSVSGVMLVFALLLALHVSTRALTNEVTVWAEEAILPYAYVYSIEPGASAEGLARELPPEIVVARVSTRTAWPNAILAARAAELAAVAEAAGDPAAAAAARRLGAGKIILSRMMSRRFRAGVGDLIEIDGRGGRARLEIVAVTDDVGYVPMVGPYRNSKTYGLIDASDERLIAPYADPIGASIVLADPRARAEWTRLFHGLDVPRGERTMTGRELARMRKEGTARDFVIFDLILALTTLLAGVGVANQMALAVHARRRELALYRVLGMTTAQVRRLVLLEGAFIGVLGGGLAALLGVPLGYAAIGALRVVSAFEVTFELPISYVVATVLGALAVSLLAAIHPALQAGRAAASESVHYE